MRYTSTFFSLLLVLVCAHTSYAQQPVTTAKPPTVFGELYFHVGSTSIPIYPRGVGNNEHYEIGLDLHFKKGRFECSFKPNLTGGSTFDNPDRFDITATGSVRMISSHTFLDIVHTDAYALNQAIVPDPFSRRPGSSVNAWWLGGRYQIKTKRYELNVFARQTFASNESLYFGHFTIPYAHQHIGGSLAVELSKNWRFTISPAVYFSNRLNQNRSVIIGSIERNITRHLVVEVQGVQYINGNAPSNIVTFTGKPLESKSGIFVGIRIPFGR